MTADYLIIKRSLFPAHYVSSVGWWHAINRDFLIPALGNSQTNSTRTMRSSINLFTVLNNAKEMSLSHCYGFICRAEGGLACLVALITPCYGENRKIQNHFKSFCFPVDVQLEVCRPENCVYPYLSESRGGFLSPWAHHPTHLTDFFLVFPELGQLHESTHIWPSISWDATQRELLQVKETEPKLTDQNCRIRKLFSAF